jgi:flagellar basal-body rod protein FlgB
MEPSGLSVFKQIGSKMRWLTQRQSVLAQNIANVDTPGFKPRDLKPMGFQKSLALAAVKTGGEASHIKIHTTSGAGRGPSRSELTRVDHDTSLSGNSVDMEVELKKSADTALEYQTMANLYQKHMGLLRMAIKGDG